MKKLCLLLCVLLISTTFVFPSSAYSNVTIRFSNVGDTKTTVPDIESDIPYTGLLVNNYPMVKVTDLCAVLGASVSYSGNNWSITRNGQTTTFVNNSTSVTATNSYAFTQYNNQNPPYSNTLYWSATAEVASQEISGSKYVSVITASKMLGCLYYAQVGSEYRVFDYRVNSTTPHSDSNQYIVGGKWISNWSTISNSNISPSYTINKVRDFSTHAVYGGQLKIAIATLMSMERVKYHYLSGGSIKVHCAFRSWPTNNSAAGSYVNSHHTRGRAADLDPNPDGTSNDTVLYTAMYNEMKGTQLTPIDAGSFWRTRVPNSLSLVYEIEKMPTSSGTWTHIQNTPGYDNAPESP